MVSHYTQSMKKNILFLLCFVAFACSSKKESVVFSPDNKVKIVFSLKKNQAFYSVSFKDHLLIDTSQLGFDLKDMSSMGGNFEMTHVDYTTFDQIWKPVYGPVSSIRNHYNEMLVHLQEKSDQKRQLNIRFRVFNDGIGFRYEFPSQPKVKDFTIMEENTGFNLTGDHKTWWIQAHYDSYEILYNTTKISEIPSIITHHKTKSEGELFMKNAADKLVALSTPVTMQVNDSLFIALHEAALLDYSDMELIVDQTHPLHWKSFLVPSKDGTKVHAVAPFNTPWRTMLIATKPGELITSHLIENLNDPCEIKDVSWIKPIKYMGIWWGYHIGKWTWFPGPKMGATTEHAMEYIDFASQHNIHGLLVEAWCVGENWGNKKTFITPNPKFDLKKVIEYGRRKGVELILHHETAGKVGEYEAQMDTAFKLIESLGLHHVKTGYAWYIDCGDGKDPWSVDKSGNIPDVREYHSNQKMIEHFTKVIKLAAKHHVCVDAHEVIKGTGEQRTWPNMMVREGERGQEYNAWDQCHGNPPEHNTILPFTWMLGGPMDFTPGIFDLTFDQYKKEQRVNTTLAQQLALYVVFYSPVQMVADLVENYRNHPAFKFISDVPVNWDTTIVLNGYPGDYLTIARKSGNQWYIGSITDENKRELVVSLDFLDKDKKYTAEIYADAIDTDLDKAPAKYEIRKMDVDCNTKLNMKLCNGGGQAVRIVEK